MKSYSVRASHLSFFCVVLCNLAGVTTAAAHQYSGMIDERRYVEVERHARAKLVQEPRNADALLGLVDVILAQGQDERIEQAAKMAELCVLAHPDNAECFDARGNVLANQFRRAGLVDAIVMAGKIREAYLRALAIDPRNYRARLALMRYYLSASMMLGGGSGKARALAAETGQLNPDVSNLMQAICDFDDGKSDQAEELALSLNLAGAESVRLQQGELLWNIGQKYLAERRFSDSMRVFAELRMLFPSGTRADAGFGMIAQEQGHHQDALAFFSSALANGQYAYLYYQIATSALALKDSHKAMAALESALRAKPPLSEQQRVDAEAKLAALRRR